MNLLIAFLILFSAGGVNAAPRDSVISSAPPGVALAFSGSGGSSVPSKLLISEYRSVFSGAKTLDAPDDNLSFAYSQGRVSNAEPIVNCESAIHCGSTMSYSIDWPILNVRKTSHTGQIRDAAICDISSGSCLVNSNSVNVCSGVGLFAVYSLTISHLQIAAHRRNHLVRSDDYSVYLDPLDNRISAASREDACPDYYSFSYKNNYTFPWL